jgi:hypothetical protein
MRELQESAICGSISWIMRELQEAATLNNDGTPGR